MNLSGEEYEDFPADFKEYMQMELNWSQIPIPNLFGTRWVFWRRQDDDPDPSLSYDNFLGSIHDVSTSLKVKQNTIRYALGKMINHTIFDFTLAQFWAATTTSEGRILLTTRNQPFSLGKTHTIRRTLLLRYRMMSREYMFYGDEESGEEQLGVPGRVFLRKLPEYNPHVANCTKKEYPQLDDALRCRIVECWGLPVFEHSSHTCVGVLEIVCVFSYSRPSDPFHERILGRINETLQEFGLRFFDKYNNCESKLASGQGQGEELSGEVVDFQNDQKIHSVEKIQATRFCQDGGLNLQPGQLDQPSTISINNTMSVVGEVNGEATAQLDSSDRLKMDLLNNGEKIVTMVTSSEEGKRKTQERKHKKTGVKIEVSSEDILKCSKMSRDKAARNLGVSISTLKRACRDYSITRWPPRNIKEVSPIPPSPLENKGQISQLNSGLSSNDALPGVAQMMPGFQDAKLVTIRAKYENNTIKFRLSLSSRFVELQQEVATRLSLEAGTYYVKYKDEENELILIACDEDLKECMSTLRFHGNTSIVVLLELKHPITNLKLDILAPAEVLSHTQLLKADVDVDNRFESSCLKKAENTSTAKAKVRGCPRKKESTSTRGDPSKFEYVEAPLKKKKQTPCHKSMQAEKLCDSKLINQFPEGIQKYISSIKNVEPDGNCGFRAVADLMGYGEDGWVQVRRELILELTSHLEDYIDLFGYGRAEQLLHTLYFFHTHCSVEQDKWMTIPDMGHLIASCYNVVLVHLSKRQCLTFLPLRSQPASPFNCKIIAIGFVHDSHFVEVILKPFSPMPPVACNWFKYRHACAEGWDTLFELLIDQFRSIIGDNTATRETIEV